MLPIVWAIGVGNVIQYACQLVNVFLLDSKYDFMRLIMPRTISLFNIVSGRWILATFLEYVCTRVYPTMSLCVVFKTWIETFADSGEAKSGNNNPEDPGHGWQTAKYYSLGYSLLDCQSKIQLPRHGHHIVAFESFQKKDSRPHDASHTHIHTNQIFIISIPLSFSVPLFSISIDNMYKINRRDVLKQSTITWRLLNDNNWFETHRRSAFKSIDNNLIVHIEIV